MGQIWTRLLGKPFQTTREDAVPVADYLLTRVPGIFTHAASLVALTQPVYSAQVEVEVNPPVGGLTAERTVLQLPGAISAYVHGVDADITLNAPSRFGAGIYRVRWARHYFSGATANILNQLFIRRAGSDWTTTDVPRPGGAYGVIGGRSSNNRTNLRLRELLFRADEEWTLFLSQGVSADADVSHHEVEVQCLAPFDLPE